MNVLQKIDPTIDFVGQEQAQKYMDFLFLIGYTLALIVGFILKDLKYTLIIAGLTFVLTLLVIVPAWPIYRRNAPKFVKVEKEKDE